MKQLFSKFLVSFLLTSAVVLSWSEYFLSLKMKNAKINLPNLNANLTKEKDTVKRKRRWIGWQEGAKKLASFVTLFAKINVNSIARKRQKLKIVMTKKWWRNVQKHAVFADCVHIQSWNMILQIETNCMKFKYLTKFWLKWINVPYTRY